MSRLAPKITLEEFKEKITPLLLDDDFPYNLTKRVESDLSKINFDFENTEFEGKGFFDYPCGYEVLSNGLPVLFVNAGGDWEIPICFILYWDGKEIRGYIPTKGNVFNKKEKCAYGSEDSGDGYDEDMIENPNPSEIRNDIINRIKII